MSEHLLKRSEQQKSMTVTSTQLPLLEREHLERVLPQTTLKLKTRVRLPQEQHKEINPKIGFEQLPKLEPFYRTTVNRKETTLKTVSR